MSRFNQNRLVQNTPRIQAFYVDSEDPTEQFPGLRIAQDIDWESVWIDDPYYYFDITKTENSGKIAVIHLGDTANTDWISQVLSWTVELNEGYGDENTTFPKDSVGAVYGNYSKADIDAWEYSDVAALIGVADESCVLTVPSAVAKLTVNTSLGEPAVAFHGEKSRRRLSNASPDSHYNSNPINTIIFYMDLGQPERLDGEEAEITTHLDLSLELERFEWNQLEGVAL